MPAQHDRDVRLGCHTSIEHTPVLEPHHDHRRIRRSPSRLVGEAEDAGLDPQEILAEIEGMAEAMRLCVEE